MPSEIYRCVNNILKRKVSINLGEDVFYILFYKSKFKLENLVLLIMLPFLFEKY